MLQTSSCFCHTQKLSFCYMLRCIKLDLQTRRHI
jgi:hypothetical protein